jgi:hypothetical protein
VTGRQGGGAPAPKSAGQGLPGTLGQHGATADPILGRPGRRRPLSSKVLDGSPSLKDRGDDGRLPESEVGR